MGVSCIGYCKIFWKCRTIFELSDTSIILIIGCTQSERMRAVGFVVPAKIDLYQCPILPYLPPLLC